MAVAGGLKMSRCKGPVIEMRFFGGLTVEETAEALRVSTDTVKRDWRLAKLWLLRELEGRGQQECGEGDHGTLAFNSSAQFRTTWIAGRAEPPRTNSSSLAIMRRRWPSAETANVVADEP